MEHVSGVEPGGTFAMIYESEAKNRVLADFSLPYLCCSKKDPVFLSLPKNKLCQKDAPIPMTIVPLNGEVKAFVNGTPIPAVTQSGGQNFFDPGLVNASYFGQTITFTVNGDPVEVQMVVHPQPSITLTIGTPIYDYVNNQAVVNFKVTNTGAGQITAYQWNFGDGHTSNAVPDANGMVAHLFSITPNENTTYHVTLNVIAENTGCSTQVPLNVELSGLQLVPCSDNFNYNGNSGAYEYNIDFGTDTGIAGINYDAISVPDRFVIEWNGQKWDSGFVGSSSFNGSLINAGVSPSDIHTANPSNGSGQLTFNKNTPTPRFAKVTVYAPLKGTAWRVSGICPRNNN
ncbi:PKD domain-containing protein [Chryseobacterium arthrosphaerae]|uniref:PKD domain-containing protein n=1 Tax=Chryseobacterium arthrosphaerae TaxID=651561 RepID=A0A3S0Q4F3_9FLAO|nr:PKD domain-containing protein [Chryseobacterium arthrosphaerae]